MSCTAYSFLLTFFFHRQSESNGGDSQASVSQSTGLTAPSQSSVVPVTSSAPSMGDPALRSDQYLSGKPAANLTELTNGSGVIESTTQPTSNTVLVKGACKDGWTDQETLLLLEALEMFRDDWNRVCTSPNAVSLKFSKFFCI